ncbi:MAG: hypothetical protein ACI8RP_000680 [Urechidicola sp.]|jgi:hypothetical protein
MVDEKKTAYVKLCIGKNNYEEESKFGKEKYPLTIYLTFKYDNPNPVYNQFDLREDILEYHHDKCAVQIFEDTNEEFDCFMHFSNMDSTVDFIYKVLDKYQLKDALHGAPVENPDIKSSRLMKLKAHRMFNEINVALN